MGICHLSCNIAVRDHADKACDRFQRKAEYHIHDSGTDNVEEKMNQCCTFCNLLSIDRCKQRRYTGTNVASKNNEVADADIQKSLLCQQKDNTYCSRRTLKHSCYNKSYHNCQEMTGQRAHDLHYLWRFTKN